VNSERTKEFSRELREAKASWYGLWYRCLKLSDITHFRPGGFSRPALMSGERPMNFTLLLSSGQMLPFELKSGPVQREKDWTAALLYFINHPTINLEFYDVDISTSV